jgi:hypothetical protein
MAQVLHCNIVNIRAAAVDCRQLGRAPSADRGPVRRFKEHALKRVPDLAAE